MSTMTVHRFYAPPISISGRRIVLGEDESHHLRRVLRLTDGTRVAVFDGTGREYTCLIEGQEGDGVLLSILDEHWPPVESPLRIRLVQGLTRGEKFEWIIQKAAELGVTEVVPLVTDYCDPWVKRRDISDRLQRWQRIAVQACKQCGRTKVPSVGEPILLDEFLPHARGITIMAAERTGRPLSDLYEESRGTVPAGVNLLIGPEGGWSRRELRLAEEIGVHRVTLGPRTLRTETAGIVLISIIQYLWGDLSKPGRAA